MYELNGRDLCGSRVVVEPCRRGMHILSKSRLFTVLSGPGSRREGGGFRGGDRGDFRGGRKSNRYGPPVQTRYRLTVENLSTRCSWQVRGCLGEVTIG